MVNANVIYDIVEELRNTSSIIDKQKILAANKNVEGLYKFFQYALDKNIIFNIKKIPVWCSNYPTKYYLEDMDIVLDELASKRGNAAKDIVNDFAATASLQLYELFSCIISKNPRCGVSSAIACRIWPDIVPNDIKLCKAMSFSEKNLAAIKYPAFVQKKCDGARCLAFINPHDRTTDFFSSNGKIYTGLNRFLGEDALAYAALLNRKCVIDGELLIVDDNNNIYERKIGNGVLNKIALGTATDNEMSHVRMVIWDIIDYEDYQAEKSSYSYDKAMGMLEQVKCNKITVVESYTANSREEVDAIFRSMIKKGEEGVIVKNKDMHWTPKRTKNAVKMKLEVEVTLKIVDTFEGTGKYAGKLGGFVCESKDGIVKVRVGSGFDDKDREIYYINNPKGACVEIAFNDIMVNDNDTYSLFLPVFKNLRIDKNEADTYDDIRAAYDMAIGLGK